MNVVKLLKRIVLRDKPEDRTHEICKAIAACNWREAHIIAMAHFIHKQDWLRAAQCRDRVGAFTNQEIQPQNPTGQERVASADPDC